MKFDRGRLHSPLPYPVRQAHRAVSLECIIGLWARGMMPAPPDLLEEIVDPHTSCIEAIGVGTIT
jgi:hypothetical protein